MDRFLDRRQALADRYDSLLADLAVVCPPRAPAGFRHGLHLYPVRVARRAEVYAAMRQSGIGVQVHYVPIQQLSVSQPVVGSFPNADAVYAELLSLPLFPDLTETEQDEVVAVLGAALTR